jgi:hypothetical protein
MEKHKENFLRLYNEEKSINKALEESIYAAVRRNKLYLTNDPKQRKLVRNFWSEQLINLSNSHKNNIWDEDCCEREIENLKKNMNDKFGDEIDFRISHSQKSISVFFKHLWCLDIISIPPQCPVDRIILTKANAPINERSWGIVNNIETHRKKIDYLKRAANTAGFKNIAEWELCVF